MQSGGADEGGRLDEWKAANHSHVSFRGRDLVVRRSSPLLGPAGLPAAIARYKAGALTAGGVARALVRARVVGAPEVRVAGTDVPELALLIAHQSQDPQLPADSVEHLAEALVEAQDAAEENAERAMESGLQAMFRGAERLRSLVEPMVDFFDRHPQLQEAIIDAARAQEAQPPMSPPERERLRAVREARLRAKRLPPSEREVIQRHADKARENIERAERLARPQRLTLQQQLMVPGDLARGIGQALSLLQQQAVRVPPSITRLEQVERPSEQEIRQASADAARLAREQGEVEGAEVLELAVAVLSDAEGDTTPAQQAALQSRLQRLVNHHGATVLITLIITLIGVLAEQYLDRLDPAPAPPAQVIIIEQPAANQGDSKPRGEPHPSPEPREAPAPTQQPEPNQDPPPSPFGGPLGPHPLDD